MLQQTGSRRRTRTKPLLNLTCADFRQNPDGSWVTTRQINIEGPAGEMMLISSGRRFDKGQMFIFGRDLVAILEQQCNQ